VMSNIKVQRSEPDLRSEAMHSLTTIHLER
jgi:hypothetical protein